MIKGEHSTEKEKDQSITCYGCRKPEHLRSECPMLKKTLKRYKKKAMMATWSDSDESSSQKEEEEQ